MSCITDELRKWARGLNTYNRNELQVLAIADRIDAEHDKALNSVDDAYDSGYNVGCDKGFASADDWIARHEEELEKHGWARMPEDADGKYWFCGDKIVLPDGNVAEIIGIGGDWLYYHVDTFALTVMGRIRAHDKRHYEQPTVKDALRQFLGECEHASMLGYTDIPQDILDTYAAKLRLAGDAE